MCSGPAALGRQSATVCLDFALLAAGHSLQKKSKSCENSQQIYCKSKQNEQNREGFDGLDSAGLVKA